MSWGRRSRGGRPSSLSIALLVSVAGAVLHLLHVGFVPGAARVRSELAAARRQVRSWALPGGTGDATEALRTTVRGEEGASSFRRFFSRSSAEISPWHDIPLHTETPAEKWMVTEIPRMTRAKMEIATGERFNPIKQDTKNGKLRDYHSTIYWNYGFLPQTWEDPSAVHPELGVTGDNDPVDVVEIGSRAHRQGQVTRVRVLGALAMIDDGELDWKVIAIDPSDPEAHGLKSVEDLEDRMPEVVSGIREWFRWYKTPDGKALNRFGFGGKALSQGETLSIVDETHEAWLRLRSGAVDAGKLWTGLERGR